LRLRIRACVARPATAKCAGMRRGRRSRPSRMEAEPPKGGAAVTVCYVKLGQNR